MLGTHPCRTDTVPADMSWVLPLPGPRFFPWNTPDRWAARPSCVPPDMSPCHPVAQPLVSDGTIGLSALDRASGLALCLPSLFPPRRPARLPALLPPVLSPLGLGAKTGTKTGGKIGATRRPPCRRGSRAWPASGAGRAAGAPPPCRGVASLPSARLNNAFWQIHRRGLGAPGPDQGCPLWLHAPRWTRGTWAIHPAALSRLWRGVASRDQPPEEPSFFDSVFRHWTRLEFLGVGHGSLPCAATAQQTNP